MRAEQVGKTTLQVASRVCVMLTRNLEAWKKDMEFWISQLTLHSRLLAIATYLEEETKG